MKQYCQCYDFIIHVTDRFQDNAKSRIVCRFALFDGSKKIQINLHKLKTDIYYQIDERTNQRYTDMVKSVNHIEKQD